MSESHPGTGRWRAPDTWLLLVVTLLALAVRLWRFGDLELTHFDEGGYAMSSLAVRDGTAPGAFYPLQHFLSPPLHFLLGGLAMRVLDTSSALALIGVAAVCGALTASAAFVVGRRAFGRAAGVAGALLLAFSDYHVMLSRTGLTDATFAFLFLLAVWLFGVAEQRRSLGFAVLAGVVTGLAWNTKYHGWLTVGVAGIALIPYLLAGERTRFARGLFRVALAAAVAALLYLPWFLHVEGLEGGYARLAAEQAHHLEPLRAPQNVWRHLQHQSYLDGWMARLAPAAAFVVLIIASRSRGLRVVRVVAGAVALVIAGIVLGGTIVAAALALAGVWSLARPRSHAQNLVLAFVLVFTVLTPLYRPYARLLLPWLIAVFMLAGAGLNVCVERLTGEVLGRWRAVVVPVAVAVVGAVSLAVTGLRRPAATYRTESGFARATRRLAELVPEGTRFAVLGEPAVVFYLRQEGFEAHHVDLPESLRDLFPVGAEVYVVGGIYGRRTQVIQEWMDRHPGAAEELARVPADVGEIRVLDDFRPRSARLHRARAADHYDLQLFRVVVPERAR